MLKSGDRGLSGAALKGSCVPRRRGPGFAVAASESPSPTLGNHIGGQPGALGVWQEAAGGPSYHSNGQRVSSGLSS